MCLETALAAGPVIRGDVACPVGQPHNFTDTWGAPRSGGRTHKGVDIFAEVGIPLYAYTAGTVKLTSSSLGGVSLWVTSAAGDRYYYAHLSRYGEGIATGTRVTAGDLVATTARPATPEQPSHRTGSAPRGGRPSTPRPLRRRMRRTRAPARASSTAAATRRRLSRSSRG